MKVRFSGTTKLLIALTAALGWVCLVGEEWRHIARYQNHHRRVLTLPCTEKRNESRIIMEKTKERLQKRREELLKSCESSSLGNESDLEVAYVKNRYLKTALFYSDKFKILFCQIPKCATRSQAKFLAALDGLISPEEMETVSEARATSLIEKHLSARKIDSIEKMTEKMKYYRKVIIVREPFSRLLSAFRNKLENNARNDGYARLAAKLHAKYGNGSERELNGAPVITLNDFISHLTDPKSQAQTDQHWNFYHRLCGPCTIKYDYVVQMDTMESDMEYLMAHFGIRNISFPPSYNSYTDKLKVNEYFAKADPSLVNALFHTYKFDYDLFGFPPPPQY